MPSKVLFNATPYPVLVTLYVRAGLAPGRVAASIQVRLDPDQEAHIEYGDAQNRYLEGLELSWVRDGVRHMQRKLVVERSSAWETTLNRSEALLICGIGEIDVQPGVVDHEDDFNTFFELDLSSREPSTQPARDSAVHLPYETRGRQETRPLSVAAHHPQPRGRVR